MLKHYINVKKFKYKFLLHIVIWIWAPTIICSREQKNQV